MKNVFRDLSVFLKSPFAEPALLALAALLAYGLWLPQLGFYWDELPMSWIRYELGPGALAHYFSTNRPVWGLLYQITTRILPQVPLDWQVFGLFWRWLSALLMWAIVRELWPDRQALALIASLFFLLYPGFNQQSLAFLYSHFFIVLCLFLFSLLCMSWSLRNRRRYWPLTLLALVCSALNLWMMEYFFALELLRPFIILCFVISPEAEQNFLQSVRRAVLLWVPYLGVFLAAVFWRLVVFNNQTYSLALLPQLQSAPLDTIRSLIRDIFADLYTVSLAAWGQIFHFPSPLLDDPRTTIYYWGAGLLTSSLLLLFLFAKLKNGNKEPRFNLWPIGLGLIAMLAAGGPFWLTGLQVSLAFPANRFTLPFMLGVTLLLVGLLELIPVRVRFGVTAVLIILAVGRQTLWADEFHQDWAAQKTLFWQMVWRAPGIKPDTLLLLNSNALQFYADNSLSAVLNWIYNPTNPSSNSISYMLFYPTSRLGGSLPSFEAGQPITYDFTSGTFDGNTSQTLAFYYRSPACLRLLDPEIDTQNQSIPDRSLMRDAAWLSSSAWITAIPSAHMPQIYGPEPAHGWCYYFEQADLARQLGDWGRVTQLGDMAFQQNDQPIDPIERFVFIEGYAHSGDWGQVREQSNMSYAASHGYAGPLLCELFARIDRETPPNWEEQKRLNNFRTRFSCLP